MAAKFIAVLALVAVAHGSFGPLGRTDDYSSFAYNVADPYTGDYKNQVESRSGGNVQGQYSLLESDGTHRTVDYAADDVNGFNAVVRRDPAVIAAGPLASVSPAVLAARNYAAPAIYSPGLSAFRDIVAPAVYSPQAFAPPSVYNAPSVFSSRLFNAPAIYTGGATYSGSALCHAQPTYCY